MTRASFNECIDCGALYSYPASRDRLIEGTDIWMRGEFTCVGCERKRKKGVDLKYRTHEELVLKLRLLATFRYGHRGIPVLWPEGLLL